MKCQEQKISKIRLMIARLLCISLSTARRWVVGCVRERQQPSQKDRRTPSVASQRNDEAFLLSLWQREVLGNLSGNHL